MVVMQAAVYFWAPWCQPCKQLDEVFAELAKDSQQAAFIRVRCERNGISRAVLPAQTAQDIVSVCCIQVEAEEVPDITDRYGVTVVPYFLVIKVSPTFDPRLGLSQHHLLSIDTSPCMHCHPAELNLILSTHSS